MHTYQVEYMMRDKYILIPLKVLFEFILLEQYIIFRMSEF